MIGVANKDSVQPYMYVITESSEPTSLDPLDADGTQNLPVARMIYATPIEIDSEGALISPVLESFTYDSGSSTVRWTVKSGLKFTDGSDIEPMDIAFAVARMAYTRPHFPVIENIVGVADWSQKTNALESLPSGLTVSGQTIEIRFSKNIDHPLFRFCLEIFSIIPRRCVDLKTNKVTCDRIPGSGRYEITEKRDSEIHFSLRSADVYGSSIPNKIIFKYQPLSEIFNGKPMSLEQTIIQGNEIKLSPEQNQNLNQFFQSTFTPSARIGLNLINPNVPPFDDKRCRQFFAQAYREAYKTIMGSNGNIESSVFTDVLPGYMKDAALKIKAFNILSETDTDSCREKFVKSGLPWGITKDDKDSIYGKVMENIFDQLKIPKTEAKVLETRKQEVEAFINGEIAVIGASTGFWALDPAGDIQMLLTPNMHKILQFVAQDEKLQKLIRNLKANEDSKSDAFRALNQYLHDEALFNVFTHVRRFYAATDENLIAELPISITSPAPWQVFRISK